MRFPESIRHSSVSQGILVQIIREFSEDALRIRMGGMGSAFPDHLTEKVGMVNNQARAVII